MGLVAKAFQDIITFSRASAGTYVNSNGYITNSSVLNYLTYSNAPDNAAWTKSNSFVQTNLLTYSEQLDNAAWIKSNASVTANQIVSPDGTSTADKLLDSSSNTNHFIAESPTLSAGTHTVSVYAKVGELRRLMIRENSFLGGAGIFDLSSGTVVASISGVTASIASVGNGWYRCSVVNPSLPGGVTQFGFYVMPDTATTVADAVYIGTGTNGIYVWGAQLVQGSVPGDYRATTSAALPVLYADYQGVVRARKIAEDATNNAHAVGGAVALIAGQVYTFSAYMKAGERTYGYLQINDGVSNAAWTSFNLSNGTVAQSPTAIIGTFAGMSSSITPVANGYYRVSFTITASITATYATYISISNDGVTRVYTGNGSSGIYIADAQLNDGSTATAYYDTTASAYNAPRFDYDPVTLAAKGLLIEEQRANLLLYSNAFTSAPWVAGANTNLTATSALSPDGTVNAWKLYASNGLVAAGLRQPITKAASAITYAASVYAKAAGQNWLQLTVFDGTVGNRYWYNISTGAVGTTAAIGAGFTGVSASIVPAGNGYYRCVLLATSSTATTYEVYVYPSAADGSNGTGDASNNGVYIYGAQLEAGAFATSYIPTTTSQFTRAADVASVNTLSPWFNAVAGTLYGEFTPMQVSSGTGRIAWFDDTDTAVYQNYIATSNNVTITEGLVGVSGVAQANLNRTPITANTTAKSALAYATNDFALCLNAGTVATDTLGSVPTGIDKLWLGTLRDNTYMNGWFRRFTYYPRRLTNAELQSLTTL